MSMQRASRNRELTVAIGLAWGHLKARQFVQADQLLRGCLRVWPQDQYLQWMAAYAAVELSRALDEASVKVLQQAECREWATVVLRRAGRVHSDAQ